MIVPPAFLRANFHPPTMMWYVVELELKVMMMPKLMRCL